MKKRISASELINNLKLNRDYVLEKSKRDNFRIALDARDKIEQNSILIELKEEGFNFESVWELVNSSNNYAILIPILLRHLSIDYSDRTKEAIARSLAVPDASYAWSTILNEYKNSNAGTGFKNGLATAISVICSDEFIDEISNLLDDKRHGDSRLLILRGLKKLKSAKARYIIDKLSNDPDFSKEINSWSKL
ncbi:hypothetical protein J2Y55_003205 [Bosea sp. BE125]|uniref:hypothetical protein n=1 Tax=Bosea sp. BE125 TaxID=2817909 RepID=UPI0028574209|nr:hypothetical protein [Bosea sp. BE125]MDR6872189.1 hypothetical protein [Bosea sp. BE125]